MGNAFGFEIPIYDSGGEVISTLDASITYMLLDLAYQQAVTDWLAFWIQGSGVGRIGTNVESILSQGVSALAGFELGGIASLDLNTRTKVPLGFAFGFRHTSYPEASGDLIEHAGLSTFRIAYTGRRELSGPVFSSSRASRRPRSEP